MKRNRVRIIQGILFLAFTISASILIYDLVIVPKQNQELAKHLKEEFPEKDTSSPGTGVDTEGEDHPAGKERSVLSIDFPTLQKAYPDVKGWLTIPDTTVDYPVLQSMESQPDYYLKRNYRGEEDVNGCGVCFVAAISLAAY